MTEPKRAWRFLPVRDERLQEPALLGGRMGTASAKGDFARLTLMPCASYPVFEPTDKLIAMTA